MVQVPQLWPVCGTFILRDKSTLTNQEIPATASLSFLFRSPKSIWACQEAASLHFHPRRECNFTLHTEVYDVLRTVGKKDSDTAGQDLLPPLSPLFNAGNLSFIVTWWLLLAQLKKNSLTVVCLFTERVARLDTGCFCYLIYEFNISFHALFRKLIQQLFKSRINKWKSRDNNKNMCINILVLLPVPIQDIPLIC